MDGVKALGLRLGEVDALDGTNLESFSFDAFDDLPGDAPFDGIRFDDGQGPLGHPAILSQRSARLKGSGEGAHMTPMAKKQQDDQDVHKGAVEGDRPGDEQIGNPNGTGVNDEGMPDDPVATAEDVVGANEDESQG